MTTCPALLGTLRNAAITSAVLYHAGRAPLLGMREPWRFDAVIEARKRSQTALLRLAQLQAAAGDDGRDWLDVPGDGFG